MKIFTMTRAAAVLFCAAVLSANVPRLAAQTIAFYSDFNSGVPAGMTLLSNAVVNGGYLKLTTNVISQTGIATIDNLPATHAVVGFRATFKAALFGGGPIPADGFSFNLVPSSAPIPAPWEPEEGLTTGLSITFDTYNNVANEAPAIEVRLNGVVVGRTNYQASASPAGATDASTASRDVLIHLDNDGTLDLAYGGTTLFSNLATPYRAIRAAKWVIAARTGGSVDNHWIDDLSLVATVLPTADFASDFNSGVPGGMTLLSNAIVNGGFLKLTTNISDQRGIAIVSNLPPTQGVLAFDATFKAAVFGSINPPQADGFSFNLVNASATLPAVWGAEDGLNEGLSITFDTYNNGLGEAPAVEVLWNGALMGRTNFQVSATPLGVVDVSNALRNVTIRLDLDGTLDLIYGTNVLFTNLVTSYQPIYSAKWVLGARTGFACDNHWIDDLNLSAVMDPFPAATFSSGFNAGVPAGMTLFGSAMVSDGFLKLTRNIGGQVGIAVIDNFPSQSDVLKFEASFKAAVFGGTFTPADGFSFNLVPAAFSIPNGWAPEEGLNTGLSVTFDTYVNVDEPSPTVEILWNGSLVARTNFQASAGRFASLASALRDVIIRLDADGTLDVRYGANVLFDNLVTPYQPLVGAKWILGARTGAAFDNHWIDDLNIKASFGADYIRGRIFSGSSGVPNISVAVALGPIDGPGQLAIPDGGTIEATNVVVGSGNLTFAKVDVNISHSFGGDLELTLIHPDGTEVRLKDPNVNDDGQDFIGSFPDQTVSVGSLVSLNGKAIAGAWRLRVRDAFAQDIGVLNGWSLRLGMAPAITDASGNYAFSNLFNGTFTVQPQRDGFVFSPAFRIVTWPSANVNFDLLSGFIAGRVTTHTGAGFGGVTVAAGAFASTTESNGNYRLTLPPGHYTVAPELVGHDFTPTQLTVVLGETNANFAAVGYPVSGRITDVHTNGVRGVMVSAGAQNAVSDADGFYRIASVLPGSRTITPSRGLAVFAPGNRIVNVTGATADVDFTITSSPPVISDIQNVVIAKGSSTGPIRFTVGDVETRAGLLQLTANSTDTSLVPVANILLDGVGSDRTVTVTPIADRSGTATITVTVTDESGFSTSDAFAVRVNAAPIIGVGRSLNLDGVNDAVQVNAAVLGNKGNFTVEAWVSAPSNAGPRTLFVQGHGTNLFSIGVTGGQIRVSGVWDTGVPFPYGGWHHLAIVKETANARLYIDGVLRASRGSTLPLPAQTNRFDIGRSASGEFWLGGIDEVRVWEGVRSAGQIASNQNTRVVAIQPGLLALWRFDESSGATAFDTSPRALHGTLVDGPAREQSAVLFAHYVTTEDTPFPDVLQAIDPDNDALTFTLVTLPQRGTVTLLDAQAGSFTYRPNPNASGSDSFSFSVNDGFADTDVSLLTVSIEADINPPTISFVPPQTMAEDTTHGPITFTVGDAEVVASNVTVTAVCSPPSLVPTNGFTFSGTGSNRTMTIRPATNQNGSATVTLTVSDGKLTTASTFALIVTPVNDAPEFLVLPTNQVAALGAAISQSFTIGDVDNDANSLQVTSSGSVQFTPVTSVSGVGATRTVNVTASTTNSGVSTVTLRVNDGALTNTATFTVRVDAPPVIAAIGNRTTFRNVPTRPISITITDGDQPLSEVTVTAVSSDRRVVAPSGFQFGGSPGQQTLVITPVAGQAGIATITVLANDGYFTASRSFQLFVEEGHDYTFIELPNLPGAEGTAAMEINDSGRIMGNAQFSGGNVNKAVVWDVTGPQPQISALPGDQVYAKGMNNQGDIVGYRQPGGAFLYRNGAVANIGNGNVIANAYDINDAGAIVGEGFNSINSDKLVYFDGVTATNLNGVFYSAEFFTRPLYLNNSGDVFGGSTQSLRALVWQLGGNGARTLRDLGNFGGEGILPGGINDRGDICANVFNFGTGRYAPYIYNYKRNAGVTNLEFLMQGLSIGGVGHAMAMNNSGEVVGSTFLPIIFNTLDPDDTGFLYSDGRAYRLQDLVPTSVFWPYFAWGINDAGDIVGVGYKPGVSGNRAFMLKRQTYVGQPVSPPLEANNPATQRVYQPPSVEVIDGTAALHSPLVTWLWSDFEQKLYFLRPVTARVTWLTTTDLANTNPPPPIVRTVRAVWPANPQIHVAGAPVEIEPLDASSPYRAVALSFTTGDATFDLASKSLNAGQPGHSVIRYLIAPETPLGSNPNALTHSNYFQVVQTVAWDTPGVFRDAQPAVVGTKVSDPRGPGVATNSPKSGWVVFPNAPYDSAGPDRAHDRVTQTGPIIPVNRHVVGRDDDLVVAFYQRNPITDALWPDLTARFDITWPVGAQKLVIADSSGSGPLPPAEYPDKRIYNQPDRTLPGFNPNEEHAFFAPVGSGQGVFALRNDLNAALNLSSTFVLLKYRDPIGGEWRMKPFEVALTDPAHTFTFTGEAGKEILPPYPLSLFPTCPNQTRIVSGRVFTDHRGKLYAKHGPIPSDPNPTMVIQYYYPLQPGFFYDLNQDGANDEAAATCIQWRGLPAGTSSILPVDVTYRIVWPTNSPTLQIGETLLTATRGLPDIRNFAAANVVFDTRNPDGNQPLSATARLYDPLSARTLRITNVAGISSSYQFPASVAMETVNGKQIFSDLPFHLRTRLSYDPLNKAISFTGVLNENVIGQPLLLINVMGARERDRIKELSSEARFQSIIDALYDLTRNPNRVDADGDGAPDRDLLIGFTTNAQGNVVQETLGDLPKALTAGLPLTGGSTNQTNFIVIAENNDPSLGALPVTLHVIRVDGGPFRGDLKIIFPDNVFDERLTVRHSSDFGGDPDRLSFEWWYHPDDADFNPVALPLVNPVTGAITDARGWRPYKPATSGQNFITIGEGGETSLFTLLDNWFVVRYRGYVINGRTNWSDWVGDPSSAAETRAAFAPGWVKRVIEGINPFEARTTNFHDNASVTYASMLIQAGERYEGDIALNPSGANLNSVGLIQTYSTVLNRGRRLSIEGFPPVDSDPANNALLLAASRISDLYMLLGNEAFSDAQDPTIGFFSDSLEFGTVATSIFAFQNQLDSLLEEELSLLRGRDDSASGVGGRPVYNRLLWNFTGAQGEVAYERVYNVGDVNLDGVINEFDAKILFPQGHGDAWGHYLSASKTYYDLLRHPRFTWIPRAENVLVAGTAVRVDFLDERKFAAAAAAKAKAGAEIVDLTYRSKFVDDPEGQFQGYKDTSTNRAWGVSEWGLRAGQGAYFDWLAGNSMLPSTDPNTNHVGIQKVDRQTVNELDEIAAHHRMIQAQVDKVDAGLNPLGLAKGVVPFDIDPSLLLPTSGVQALGHFEQIYLRAVQAMNNTVTMWNQANALTEALRRQQDTIDEFTANVADQERDFKSRLIEVFGYPYAGDVGAGKTYPSGYDGPDIYHYMYVDTTELTGAGTQPQGLTNGVGFFKAFTDGDQPPNFYFSSDLSAATVSTASVLAVEYPLASGGWAFTAPASFGTRRAPGELQLALSDLLQEETRLKQALRGYDNLVKQIQDALILLEARNALSNRVVTLLTSNQTRQVDLNKEIQGLKNAQLALRRTASVLTRVAEQIYEGVPEDFQDAIFPADELGRAVTALVSIGVTEGLEIAADVAEGVQNRHERDKEETQLQTDIAVEVANQDYEVRQQAAELVQLLREEAPARLECFNQAEIVRQTFGRFRAALAAGDRLIQERIVFRQRTAGVAQQNRYKDISFRIFRNDALQKYRAQFDLAARYVHLAAAAYDYELNFLGTDSRAARDFFTDIIRERSLGVMVNGLPITGRTGLSDPLARLKQNFEILSPRFGLNNPQQETARFSLRKELFRIRDGSDSDWQSILRRSVVPNLWEVPEFRRHCRPFAPEAAGPQPGIVIRFPTTITFGLNYFGFPLGGGDSAYDPSLFSTKVNRLGVWFSDYNDAGLALAPRVYFFPAGQDILRSPTGNTLATREWKILDQVVPVPFPIGANDLTDPTWIPQNDSLAESFAQIRRFSSFRAFHDSGVYDDTETTRDSRLIGRSVWNTDWVLIIPGGTMLNDPSQGLDGFINSVSDILISLQSYSYPGD